MSTQPTLPGHRPPPRRVRSGGLDRAIAEGRRRQARVLVGASGTLALLAGVLAAVLTAPGAPPDSLRQAAPRPTATSAGTATPLPVPPTTAEPSPVQAEPSPVPAEPDPRVSPSPAVNPSTAPPTPEPPGPTASTAPADPGQVLYGRRYVALDRTRRGTPWPFVRGTEMTLGFGASDRPSIGWQAGCNSTGADLTVTDDRLLVGPIGSTAMGCAQERQEQDEELVRFFGSNPQWRLADDVLTLTAGDVMIRLRQPA